MPEALALPEALAVQINVRPLRAGEEPFVLDTWVRSYRRHAPKMSAPIYEAGQRRLAHTLKERSRILVAVSALDASQLFGHIVYEPRRPTGLLVVVHYLYVKRFFRRFGIGSLLVHCAEAEGAHYTHRTDAGAAFAEKHGGHFNPYLGGIA